MIKWIGALLVIFSAGGCGLREALRLKSAVHDADRALRLLSRIETLLVLCRFPLPRILDELRDEMPDLFPLPRTDSGEDDLSGGELWVRDMDSLPMPMTIRLPLRTLGERVLSGDKPDTVIESVRRELQSVREFAMRKWAECGRLYATLGFALGCFLVILIA